ncbi:hypothetical protein [Microbacterium album]|uniref:hypothetical protein n=1 Tax=Microbacterium album TaxID=2053191 RepID=UPI001666A129|nr:hypothetical protein [Microbacterium album]
MARIAESVSSFGDFIRAQNAEVRESIPETGAAVFLGNILVHSRADAEWLIFEGEFPSVGPIPHCYEPLHLLRFIAESGEPEYDAAAQSTRTWAAASA